MGNFSSYGMAAGNSGGGGAGGSGSSGSPAWVSVTGYSCAGGGGGAGGSTAGYSRGGAGGGGGGNSAWFPVTPGVLFSYAVGGIIGAADLWIPVDCGDYTLRVVPSSWG